MTIKNNVKKYSKKTSGNIHLSANFEVREFACKNGADEVLIDDALVAVLQQIREHFGTSVTINSAYRTVAYNKFVGGSSKSQHCLGTAADIVVKGKAPTEVARYVETLLGAVGGIGLYKTFTHVDVRAKRYRWDKTSGVEKAVTGFYAPDACPYAKPTTTLRKGATGDMVKWLQWQLVKHGSVLTIDGSFGRATLLSVKAFQLKNNLTVDGIVGDSTIKALL